MIKGNCVEDPTMFIFQQLLDVVTKSKFDDITLTLTGRVKDVNRFHELDENLPYGKIGFIKHKNEKCNVEVEISKTLRNLDKIFKAHLSDGNFTENFLSQPHSNEEMELNISECEN